MKDGMKESKEKINLKRKAAWIRNISKNIWERDKTIVWLQEWKKMKYFINLKNVWINE